MAKYLALERMLTPDLLAFRWRKSGASGNTDSPHYSNLPSYTVFQADALAG